MKRQLPIMIEPTLKKTFSYSLNILNYQYLRVLSAASAEIVWPQGIEPFRTLSATSAEATAGEAASAAERRTSAETAARIG